MIREIRVPFQMMVQKILVGPEEERARPAGGVEYAEIFDLLRSFPLAELSDGVLEILGDALCGAGILADSCDLRFKRPELSLRHGSPALSLGVGGRQIDRGDACPREDGTGGTAGQDR